FRTAIADRDVRDIPRSNARVHILGLLEARLQSFDAVVVGGLVEGSWPPETRSDPWLSRPMRQELGLDLPERRIGLSAHDFAQCLGAAKVVLARAGKLGGAPTLASRFLQRLAAVVGAARWSEALARGGRYLALARTLDRADCVPIKTPAPRPPRAARPNYLTVTDVEHWLRDPYTIYAKHVLRLAPLDAVNTPPGARDRGNLIHNAIVDYKTGEVRTEKQVRAGLAPQLTLEAAILRNGGFPEIDRGASVAALVYVQLKGGEPAGEEIRIDFKQGTPDGQADRALARFTG